jgi:thioredoxin-like negative regulator of GroEL
MATNARRVDLADPCIDLIYVRAFGDFRRYEARLLELVERCGGRVRFTKATAGELTRFTNDRVFSSTTVPTLVLVRDGAVVAEAVGDLPASELARVVHAALHD